MYCKKKGRSVFLGNKSSSKNFEYFGKKEINEKLELRLDLQKSKSSR